MSSNTDHLDHNKLIIIINASPKMIKPSQIKIQEQEQEEEMKGCHTPRQDKNKIPIMLAPPPAPRKPAIKRKLSSCKRKLFGDGIRVSDQIVVKSEEIDAFFKSSFEELAAAENSAINIVKRCKCT